MKNHLFKHIGSQLKLKSFFVSILAFCLFNCSLSFAQSVPPLINYQGRLTDANGDSLTGTKRLEFNVYDAVTGGNIVWGIQIIDDVPLVDGHFNVILSTDNQGRSIANAFKSKNRYIAIKVGEPHTDLSGVSEISPRQQILSAPYAVQAEHAVHGVPAGTIIAFGGHGTPPGGWLHCARAAVSSEDYPALYAAIGTYWGNWSNDSDPRTDFNLPDLIGRFLRGRDYGWGRDPNMGSRTASQTGGNTGDAVGSVQGDATKRPNNAFTTDSQGNHNHVLPNWRYHNRRDDSGNFGHMESRQDGDEQSTAYGGVHMHTIIGGGDSETRPKNAYVNWFIKY